MYLGRLRQKEELITVSDNWGGEHKEIKIDDKLKSKRLKVKELKKKNETKQDKLSVTA